jgi:hypothetical protein
LSGNNLTARSTFCAIFICPSLLPWVYHRIGHVDVNVNE